MEWHWWQARARWIDRFAPVPSILLWIPLALMVCWDALRALDTGFWIDECGAYWLSHHLEWLLRPPFGLHNLSFFYAAILSLFAFAEPPWTEAVARVPSLLAAVGCGALLYTFCERAMGRGTGWVAAALFAILPSTLEFATEARPYALSQFTFVASLLTLHTWLHSPTPRRLAAHLASLVVLVYLHPFFALAWPLCWIYVVVVQPLDWRRYSLAMAGAAILLAPLGYVMTNSEVTVRTISYVPSPDWRDLGSGLLQNRVGGTLLALILLVAYVARRRRPAARLLGASAAIWLAWPLVLFALAHLTGSSFFIPRYLALSSLGLVLLGTAALRAVTPSWRYAAVLILVGLFLAPGSRFPGRNGDMRRLSAWLQSDGGGGSSPWLANCLFIEGSVPNPLSPETQLAGFSFAHVSTYPVPNPVFPMPWGFAEFAKAGLEAQLDGAWRQEPRIIAGPLGEPAPKWLVDTFAQRGYRYRQLGAYFYEFRR